MTTPPRRGIRGAGARTRLVTAVLVGAVVGVGTAATPAGWQLGMLVGWMAGSALYLAWMWATIWPLAGAATREHALREDPGQATVDVAVLTAAVASLGAVGLFLGTGSSGSGSAKVVEAVLTVVSVALAWAMVHTLFTVRYARMYYAHSRHGIDFNQEEDPRYSDFAYLAFTVGMTFQISDTDISRQDIRATILRHMLLSYLLGAVVIGVTVNLVAGLAK
ncbi:DUF1345 domain-containing protein [Phycicoccus ginsengisoli]